MISSLFILKGDPVVIEIVTGINRWIDLDVFRLLKMVVYYNE